MRLRLGEGPVSCRICKHENPAGARFCNDCGAHLAAPTITPEPRSYTPRHLVEKILASQNALRGERKLVTVLFADVVRSMELAERVDPEEWHRLLDRLFRILAGGVHRYEGTINQYTGDGIMALFGAPIAHEDHAQRACAAALDLARELGALAEDVRRESGLEFAVRMGLNSGEVVVGRIGDDLRMDYTAQGHVVGLAARVQQLAPPGGITVTEQTARLAAGFFGVGEGASPSDVRDAVRCGLGNVQPDPIALDFWLDLLGVSDHVPAPSGLDPEARRTRLFRSLLTLIQARARRELTLLWVEDLHWLDPASEVALEMLTERLLATESAGSRILLLATTRPEYRPVWSSGVEVLSLAPLALQDSRKLLDDWLGSDDMLAPLCARIEARARGNPLFVEEIIRSLVECGVLRGERGAYGLAAPIEEITLPETVQAVLASRIDRLADRDKDVLQAAAVVGRDVPIELLRAVVDLPAPALALMLELTSRIALFEIGRIAGIEERQARDLFDEARAVAERLQDNAGHAFLLTSYGRLCGLAGDVAQYLACAERATELAEGSGAIFEFEMRSVLAHAQLAVGRLAPARATAERALTEVARVAGLREAVGHSTAPGLCRVWWAVASAHLGRTAEAEAALEALLAEEKDRALQALYGTHAFLCEVLRLRGDLSGALAHGRRAVELAEEHGSVFSRVEAAAFLGAAELADGDLTAATSLLERALALARNRRSALWYEPRILATLADAKLAAGDRSGARALLAEARELVDRGRGWRLGAFDVALAWVRLLASEPASDRTAIASALESVDALTAELGSDPYRRIAALERARLA